MKKENINYSDYLFSGFEKSKKMTEICYRNCVENFSEESVHDFRVSLRRLLAAVNLLMQISNSAYLPQLRKEIKKQIKVFNQLRDTQVQLIILSKLRWKNPDFNHFYYYLINLEKILISDLQINLSSLDMDTLNGLFFFSKIELRNELPKIAPKRDFLFEIIESANARMLEMLSNVETTQPETIHKVRITFKNLRYIVEILAPVLKINDKIFKKFKNLQTLLGEIQDYSVLLDSIDKFFYPEIITISTEEAIITIKKILDEYIFKFISSRQMLEELSKGWRQPDDI